MIIETGYLILVIHLLKYCMQTSSIADRHIFQEQIDQIPQSQHPLSGHLLIVDTFFLGPDGVHYREVLLYPDILIPIFKVKKKKNEKNRGTYLLLLKQFHNPCP